MDTLILICVILGLAAVMYRMGMARALRVGDGTRPLHSTPVYHGLYVALWCVIPSLAFLLLWLMFEPAIVRGLVLASLPDSVLSGPDGQPLSAQRIQLIYTEIGNVANGLVPVDSPAALMEASAYKDRLHLLGNRGTWAACLAIALGGTAWALSRITPVLRTRNKVESVFRAFILMCSGLAILTTLGIVLSLVFESLRFFAHVSVTDFLFGLHWSPQTATGPDVSKSFGAVPLFAGTFLIAGIALVVAVPIGLMSAIYMSEYAHPRFRAVAKPLLEVLAGIPTVVYGFFAALAIAPLFRSLGEQLGLDVSSESALAAGVVMGVMIVPFVSSLSDDVISAVPRSLREGSLGLGATKSETIRRVVIPAALPGIVGGVLLAASRAIGETMIVVMAAGMAARLTANPFEAVTTVTVQIVTLLVGDQEFDSPKTLAAFALGLVLFCLTLIMNIVALYVVRKYREQYD
ncbi:phosphate ABC transporter permease subunit PstC [Phaeovibrio sulfidiphilus]|uniref:Phosphate transport system permease protein n=1 Tax=Phaeovibrio sulfidiphilus TaxID=1220600 RepID=A0A8J6YP84_9PROT|nr:phosphate ABC transporter permease subunit PstC [Phaeovibrio sulfidiphilus]MBE1236667.1 phosphate ABC transporter permease subunit PstC [Phaeovibrio sulfidiphilus]